MSLEFYKEIIHGHIHFRPDVTSTQKNEIFDSRVTLNHATKIDLKNLSYPEIINIYENESVLRLPFRLTYFELPDGKSENGDDVHIGILAAEEKFPTNECEFSNKYYFFIREKTQHKIWIDNRYTILLDKSGRCYRGDGKIYSRNIFSQQKISDEYDKFYLQKIFYIADVLSCKNITLDENRITKEREIRHFKKRNISDKYYILKVRPHFLTKSDGPSGNHRDMALHMVRGHIARYRPEKPHVSGFVGNLFISSHLRGNPDHGTVSKDYEYVNTTATPSPSTDSPQNASQTPRS